MSSEGTDTQCINQKAHLMSEQNQLSPDWVAGLEGNTVNCEDVTIRLSTSLPILWGCLNVTCVQCENGKSISPIDSAQPTMAHDADTDSDLARPPDGKHPSARNATPAMLLLSATRRRTAGHVVAHPGPSDSESGHRGAMDGSCSADSEIEEERAQLAEGRKQEDRGRIRADDVYPECWRSIH